jgi:mannosylglycoprotein endo-beta-mannosidase
VSLNFRAINYSAEVYINGHKEVLPKGMFRRHTLDITEVLHPDGTNLLAVLVHPPDHPGTIPPQGGQGGDHEVSMIYSKTCYFHSISPSILFFRKGIRHGHIFQFGPFQIGKDVATQYVEGWDWMCPIR